MLESLKCEVIVFEWLCALPLSVEVVLVERGVVYSRFVLPKSSVEVPCVGVLCGQVSGLKILLCEGGDVELGAQTSKHILVFAFDPLSLTPSLSYIVH